MISLQSPSRCRASGFTLLELMVTVAIVGILAAIAIPIYNSYITKTRIADALTHGRVYAGKVAIDREDVVDPPANLDYSTISLAGWEENPRVRIMLKENIVSAVLIGSDESAGGKVIVLSEESSDASVRWACTTNLPQALIPEGCDHDESVKDRKLLEAWAGKGDACWSRERKARGKSGWAAGPCSSCIQGKTQRKAKRDKDPGPVDKPRVTCSGQYIDDETLALIEDAEAEDARVAQEAATVEEPAVVIEETPVIVPLLLPELSPAEVAEEARVAALTDEERAREEAWDHLIASGKIHQVWAGYITLPWAEVPAKARENDYVTPCWNKEVSRASHAEGGDGNGWVLGTNTVVEQGRVPMYKIRNMADRAASGQEMWDWKSEGNTRSREEAIKASTSSAATAQLHRVGAYCVEQ